MQPQLVPSWVDLLAELKMHQRQPSCIATKCGETGTTRGGINFVGDSAALITNRVNKNSTSMKQETGSVSLNPLSLTITQSWAEKKKSGSKCQATQLKQNGNVLSIVLLNTALSKASCSLLMKRFENYDLFSKPLALRRWHCGVPVSQASQVAPPKRINCS